MEQDGQHRERVTGSVDEALPGPPLAPEGVLAGPRHPDHDRVDRLEVGRVGGHRDRDAAAVTSRESARGALVVLDVTRPLDRLGVEIALELLEDLAVGLAHDVGEHVEPAAVGHAHDRLVEPLGDRLVQQGVEDHDGRLRTLEAEPLLADVAGVEEAFEDLGGVQAVEDVALLVRHGHRGDAFDVLLDPPLLAGVLDVHVLDRRASGSRRRAAPRGSRRGWPRPCRPVRRPRTCGAGPRWSVRSGGGPARGGVRRARRRAGRGGR